MSKRQWTNNNKRKKIEVVDGRCPICRNALEMKKVSDPEKESYGKLFWFCNNRCVTNKETGGTWLDWVPPLPPIETRDMVFVGLPDNLLSDEDYERKLTEMQKTTEYVLKLVRERITMAHTEAAKKKQNEEDAGYAFFRTTTGRLVSPETIREDKI